MTGTYNHWVVAYAATAATAAGISVMDPYNGELITLQRAMEIESATAITENRIAYKYTWNTRAGQRGGLHEETEKMRAAASARAFARAADTRIVSLHH